MLFTSRFVLYQFTKFEQQSEREKKTPLDRIPMLGNGERFFFKNRTLNDGTRLFYMSEILFI